VHAHRTFRNTNVLTAGPSVLASKVQVYGRSIIGTAGSRPAQDMHVRLLCCPWVVEETDSAAGVFV
jgi:hypothetical protein